MRPNTFVAATTLLMGTSANAANIFGSQSTILSINSFLGFDLTKGNHYGAPIPPWKPNHKPGWYYGPNTSHHPNLPCLEPILCKLLALFPNILHCPPPYPTNPNPPKPTSTTKCASSTTAPQPTNTPPADGYTPVFTNLTGAIQADDYLTFGLVDTIADCKTMCNGVQGCVFINTYHDVNGKDGSTQLTCSLFSHCHDKSAAINYGGQSQPNGSIDYIVNSDGYCKA